MIIQWTILCAVTRTDTRQYGDDSSPTSVLLCPFKLSSLSTSRTVLLWRVEWIDQNAKQNSLLHIWDTENSVVNKFSGPQPAVKLVRVSTTMRAVKTDPYSKNALS